MLGVLAGARHHLVAPPRQHRHRGAADSPGRARDQHGTVWRPETAVFEREHRQRGRESRSADDHRVARRQRLRERHDPGGRHARQLREATVVGYAEVVAVDDDPVPFAGVGIIRGDHRTGEVDAGDERRDARHSAVGTARERGLVVDARPFDTNRDLTRGQRLGFASFGSELHRAAVVFRGNEGGVLVGKRHVIPACSRLAPRSSTVARNWRYTRFQSSGCSK